MDLNAPVVTGADLYARLRRVGETYLPADRSSLIAAARRLAKADGLRVHQSRPRNTSTMSPSQARHRPITVCLTDQMGTAIVRPDASENEH